MTCSSVHREIESHAATRGDRPALLGAGAPLSYRDLNQRANGLARRLIASGLRRGSIVVVRMEKSSNAVMVLLAILKAGAASMWIDPRDGSSWPYGVSITDGGTAEEQRYRALDLTAAFAEAPSGPNLPIVTRPTDIACVLSQGNGSPGVLVPHETITLLQAQPIPESAWWSGDAGAIELWIALMAGATVSLTDSPAHAAAA